jgi:ABC-type branched-subunit amino acid transport system ATPase component
MDLVRPRRPQDRDLLDSTLDRFELSDVGGVDAAELSHGQRKRVSVARAMASDPTLLVLDEPAAGLDTEESRLLGVDLRRLVDDGRSILLIDHDMSLVLTVCDYIYVLDFGKVIASGTPAEIRQDSTVRRAYLGSESAGSAPPVASSSPRDTTTGTTLLRTAGLDAGYGDVRVVRDLSLTVDEGEVVALLGPNGAGKTTSLLTISGILPPLGGSVEVMGRPVTGRQPHRVARRGVAQVAEDRSLFLGLTVAENLRVAGQRVGRRGTERALEIFPALEPLLHRRAGLLSGGEQQMLAVARAIAGKPRLLIIDEMSLGLAPLVVEGLLPVVRDFARTSGAGVLLVEQHVQMALNVADRAYVLDHGRLTFSGRPDELDRNRGVLDDSYLGSETP